MPILVAAVVLAIALCLLNLLLTLAILRRLRATESRSAQRGVLAAGDTPAEFAASDTDGKPLTRDELRGTVLVGFFSTTCGACTEELPNFLRRAAETAGGRSQVLAVVQGDAAAAADLAGALAGVARVVVEEPNGPVGTAFQVAAMPAWTLLDDGTVRDSGIGVSPTPVMA